MGHSMNIGTTLMNDMMDGGMWGWPYMWIWVVGIWMGLAVIAILVYQDAQKRGMNGLLWLVLILIPMFGFVALVIYLVIRETGNPSTTGGKSAGALLDERYARGDISRDEYLKIKEDLQRGSK